MKLQPALVARVDQNAGQEHHQHDDPEQVNGVSEAEASRLELVAAARARRRLVGDLSAARRTPEHSHAAPPPGGYTQILDDGVSAIKRNRRSESARREEEG